VGLRSRAGKIRRWTEVKKNTEMRFLLVLVCLCAIVAQAQASTTRGSLQLPKAKVNDSKKKLVKFDAPSLVAASKASGATTAAPAQLPDVMKLLIGAGGKTGCQPPTIGFHSKSAVLSPKSTHNLPNILNDNDNSTKLFFSTFFSHHLPQLQL